MKKDYNVELDFTLELLIKAYENNFKGFKDAFAEAHATTKAETTQKLKDKFGLEDWEIKLLFEKLLIDKYIKSIEPLEITIEGLIFSNNGGYTQNKITLSLEKTRIQNLEDNTLKNNVRLVTLTMLLLIGTLIAGWYYLTELWKYYHQNCHH